MSKTTFLFALAWLLTSCAIRDIRPDTSGVFWNEEKGRALLEKAARIHGVNYWKELETYEISISDQYYGWVGKLISPYPGNEGALRLQYIPESFTGRAIFDGGKWDKRIWGLQSWQAYILSPRGKLRFNRRNDITFHLSAYQYFIEFPLRITEAPIVAYIGEKMERGQTYLRVFATWKSPKPQIEFDQYIIWINAGSGRIDKLEYTLRDIHKSLHATAYFRHYRRVSGGLLLPEYISISSPLQLGTWLHEWQLKDFVANPVPAEELGPLSGIPLSKGTAKPTVEH